MKICLKIKMKFKKNYVYFHFVIKPKLKRKKEIYSFFDVRINNLLACALRTNINAEAIKKNNTNSNSKSQKEIFK